MHLFKSTPPVASSATAAAAAASSSQSRDRNNCLVIGQSNHSRAYSPINFSVTTAPASANFQSARRSLCSVNSSSAGSRCSSRSSSSSGTSGSQASGNLVNHLSFQAASQQIRESHQPVGQQRDPLADPLETLEQQLASRAARAQSFSRVNLKQHQQNLKSGQQPAASVFELVDKYLTPTRASYATNLKQQQQQRAAANRSQSVSAPRCTKRPAGGQRSDSSQAFVKFSLTAQTDSKAARAPKRVNSCIAPSSTGAGVAQQSRAGPARGTRAKLAGYVNSVRGSSLSSIQTRLSSASSASCSSSLAAGADSHHHQHHHHQQQQQHHHSLLHSGCKRRNAHSSSSSASLLASLFGAEPAAHSAPSSGSLMNCVRRELTKLLKSF